MGYCITVVRLILDQVVEVRILVPQPIRPVANMATGLCVSWWAFLLVYATAKHASAQRGMRSGGGITPRAFVQNSV